MIGIYARQSIDKKDSLSIEAQIEKCVALCSYKGKEYKVYTDKGYSGKNTERPALGELMQDVKNNLIDEIVVYRLDRISRNLNDFTNMIQTLDKYNCTFASATESFDTATPMGRAMMYLLIVFAQLERENIAERIKDNAMYRATLGRWTGGVVPFGYDKVRNDGKTVLHHNDDSKIVEKIFEYYLSVKGTLRGTTYNANLLKYGDREWSTSTIGRILKNLIYATNTPSVYDYFLYKNYTILNERTDFDGNNGMMFYRARQNDNKRRQGHKELEQYIIIGEHKGIIDGDMWVKAQNKLNHNKATNARPNAGKISWLTSLVRCGYCGGSMGIFWSQSKVARHHYFKCRRKEMNGKFLCPNKAMRMDALENYVYNEIKKICNDKKFLSKLENKSHMANVKPLEDNSKAIMSQIKEKEKDIQNLASNLKKLTSDSIVQMVEKEISTIENDINQLKVEYKKIIENILNCDNVLINKKFVLENYQRFLSEFDSADVEHKKILVSSIIKTIHISSNKINIELFIFDT